MEDKHLTTQESLDLIAKMIENTRRNFNSKGGAMFLIWGGTCVAVSVAVFLLVMFTKNYAYQWAWWALPVIGYILTSIHLRKNKTGAATHMDKIVWYIWIVAGIICIAIPVAGTLAGVILHAAYNVKILFTIGLLVSGATATTGLVIKYRPVVAGGFAGIALALALPLFSYDYQTLVFAGIFLIAQVIPGIMLNVDCRKKQKS